MKRAAAAVFAFLISTPIFALSGIVFSTNGEPVAGARIEVLRTERPELKSHPPIATTTSDERGAFSTDVKVDGAVFVVTTAKGYAPARSLVAATADDVVIQLSRAEMKSGVVRSSKGPVAGAKVLALDGMGELLATFETDDHGRYSMPEPRRWLGGLCAQHSDYAPACRWSEMQGQSLPLDMTLDAGSLVSGRVITRAGRPVAEAHVTSGRVATATTRDDGSFKIRIGPSDKTIRATTGDLAGSVPVTAGEITIIVEPGRVISGTVRDDAGRAMTGSRVLAQSGEQAWVTAVVGPKGDYTIAPLEASAFGVYVQTPDRFEVDPIQADLRRKTSLRLDFTAKKATVITGVVRDEEKRVVAGAVVYQLLPGIPLTYAGGEQVARAITGADGTFRLRATEPSGRLAALKAGFASGESEELTAKLVQRPVTITLPLGVPVSGTVVTADGKPVSGAGIIAMSAATTLGTMPIASALSTGMVDEWVKTDAAGAFTIRLNRGVHDLGIWKSGYAAREVGGIDVNERTEAVRVVLEPAVEIRGRVVHKNGKPAEGGAVYAMSQAQGMSQADLAADGSFTLGSLTPGTYTVRYGNDRHASAIKVLNAPADNVVIELPATIELHGRVTDKATGAPVGRFEVSANSGSLEFMDSNEVNDPAGEFVENVAIGVGELSVTAPGYMRSARTITVVEGKPLDPVHIALTKGRKISGRVTSAEGHPVAEANVTAGEGQTEGAMTDTEGEYELESAPTDEIPVAFSKEGFLSGHKVVPAGIADQHVDVVLSSGLKISGRVVDKSGAPVEGASVNASSQAQDAEYQSAMTDRSGAFTMSGLAAAQYTFSASKSGGGQAKPLDIDVTKAPPIVLTLGTEPTATIHGSIAGVTEGGWMMASVQASGESGTASAQVGRDGKFVIENAPVGEVTVRGVLMTMQRQASTKAVKVTVPSGDDIEVQLVAAGNVTIRGNVRSSGQPLPGVSVMFSGHDSGMFRTQTTGEGAYEISGMEPGHYSVGVSGMGASNYSTSLDVTDSTTFDINVTFMEIHGRVLDDQGVPIEGTQIKASPVARPDSSDASATSDASGAFTMNVQGDSGYRLSATKKGFAVATTDVSATNTVPVTLQLHRSEGARVRLIDTRTGSTLSGFVVVREEPGPAQIPVSGDRQADGSLLIPLAEGSYRVSASANEYASNTVHLTVPSAETAIPLTRGGTLIVQSSDNANELIKLVMPNGEEYVRCYCNGIAEIRLTGALTKIEHVAPGAFRMDVVDSHEVTKRSYPITIVEGQTTTVDATK